jgi:hypothetical protein
MTIPPDPLQSSSPPVQPGNSPQGTSGGIDPSGAWSKFLSTPGHVATPEEVKMFMQGMLKMFNLLIQQQSAAYKRANEQLKKAVKGDE